MTRQAVTVLIDRDRAPRYAEATFAALADAIGAAHADLEVRELPTAAIDAATIGAPGRGVVVGPGSPYENPEGVLDVIRSARERGVPLVGT